MEIPWSGMKNISMALLSGLSCILYLKSGDKSALFHR